MSNKINNTPSSASWSPTTLNNNNRDPSLSGVHNSSRNDDNDSDVKNELVPTTLHNNNRDASLPGVHNSDLRNEIAKLYSKHDVRSIVAELEILSGCKLPVMPTEITRYNDKSCSISSLTPQAQQDGSPLNIDSSGLKKQANSLQGGNIGTATTTVVTPSVVTSNSNKIVCKQEFGNFHIPSKPEAVGVDYCESHPKKKKDGLLCREDVNKKGPGYVDEKTEENFNCINSENGLMNKKSVRSSQSIMATVSATASTSCTKEIVTSHQDGMIVDELNNDCSQDKSQWNILKKNLLGYPILWFQPASSFFNNEPSLIKNLFFWVQEPDSLISSCVKHASLDNTVEQLEKMILNKNMNYDDLIGMKLPQRLIQIGKNDPQGIGRLICIADYCQINIIVVLTSKIDQHMIV